jgi:antitoxin component of MazEF toxin-antitoxin module
MNETYKIRTVGGCLMLTIPRKVSEVMRLRAGDEVKIGIVNIGTGGTMTVDHVKKTKGKVNGRK